MRIIKGRNQVVASVHTAKSSGTVFYKITMKELLKLMKSEDCNVWIMKSFEELGWDAIDFESNLFGSKVIDDVLYLCVSDGYDIDVDGELYDPESVLDDLGEDGINNYIQKPTKEVVTRYITEYEVNTPDFDGWAADLLSDGYSFEDLVRDYHEFD